MICTLRHTIINALVVAVLAENKEVRRWNPEARSASVVQGGSVHLTLTAQPGGLEKGGGCDPGLP